MNSHDNETASPSLSTQTRWRPRASRAAGVPRRSSMAMEDEKADETADEMLKAPDESD